MNPFIYALCEYIALNTTLDFGTGETNLKINELSMDTEGVYAVDEPSLEPDRYTPVRYADIGFWAKYKRTPTCYDKLQEITRLLDRQYMVTVGTTTQYQLYFSCLVGGVTQGMDRDGQGDSLLKMTLHCIFRPLDMVS